MTNPLLQDLAEVMRRRDAARDADVPDRPEALSAYLGAAASFFEVHHAAIEQNARDAERWRELCRQIDAEPCDGGSVLHSILDDAVNMGAGALERHITDAMKENGHD